MVTRGLKFAYSVHTPLRHAYHLQFELTSPVPLCACSSPPMLNQQSATKVGDHFTRHNAVWVLGGCFIEWPENTCADQPEVTNVKSSTGRNGNLDPMRTHPSNVRLLCNTPIGRPSPRKGGAGMAHKGMIFHSSPAAVLQLISNAVPCWPLCVAKL